MTVANPYSAGPIVTDAEMFFGREEELRCIRDRLRKGGSMAVIGLRRIGKSSLLYQLAHQADQLPEGAVAAYLEAPEVGLIPAPLAEQSILALLDGRLPEFTVNPDIRWRSAGPAAE